jgi:hypothetical protein
MAFTRGRYYQHNITVNGRQQTLYFGLRGAGQAAEFAAERAARREALRAARREALAHRDGGRLEEAVGRLLDDVLALELGREGYSRISRGPWRRRAPMKAIDASPMTREEREAVVDRIQAAVTAVGAGEVGALDRLRELGALYPAAVVAATQAEPGRLAAMILARAYDGTGKIPAMREGTLIRFEQVAAELAGEDPTPCRRLCARRAAYCEMEVWQLSMEVAAAPSPSPALDARLTAADKRLMRSLKTLAQISRLERPSPRPLVATQIHVTAPVVRTRTAMDSLPGDETIALEDF